MARNGTAANRRRGDGVIMPQSRVRGAGAIVRFGHQPEFTRARVIRLPSHEKIVGSELAQAAANPAQHSSTRAATK
jgi:hypothetical protein